MSSKEKNLVIIRSVLEQRLNPSQAAARFKVSRQWAHVLLGRYRAQGQDGAQPRSRGA